MAHIGKPAVSLSSIALQYVDRQRKVGRFNGKSPKVIRSVLLNFARAVGDPEPAKVKRRHVERWMENGSWSRSTQRTHFSTVRAFCRWMVGQDIIPKDPTAGIGTPKLPRHVPRGLTAEAVGKLLAVLPDARAELIVSLMVQEGLRCTEVATLQIANVDMAGRAIRVVGKGGHERILPITPETWTVMHRYLSQYPAAYGPLVRSYTIRDAGLGSPSISKMVGEWASEAGIKASVRDGVSAHALRHTCAQDVLRGGANLRDVQQMLGHSSIATTQIYLPLLVGDLRASMGGRNYREPLAAKEA